MNSPEASSSNLGLDNALHGAAPISEDAIDRLACRFDMTRRQVAGWVDEANRITEKEVLAAGEDVSKVVAQSRDQAANLSRLSRRVCVDEADRASVSTAISMQAATAQEMVTALRGHTERLVDQSSASQQCVELIVRVSAQIDSLSHESNILSLNARIEAARSGANGAAFQVVASEMNRLSQQVKQANSQVRDLADRLGELLPALAASAGLARADTERLGDITVRQGKAAQSALGDLQADVGKAISESEAAVARVLRLSQDALSHLQFQDVVSQSLRSIDAVIHSTAVDVLGVIGAPEAASSLRPPAYTTLGLFMDESLAEAMPESGDVMLF